MANIKTNTTTIQSILETINALPEAGSGNGVDVSGVTATPTDVLAPKVFVDADGNEQTGTLTTEELTGIEPTTEEQTFTPDSGKLYSKVVINAIDPSYIIPKYTQEENTWTPTTEEQTIPAGTYCSGTQTIGAIPTDYIKPTGEKSITSNGTYNIANYASANINVPIPSGYVKPTATQAAKTWTPTTSEQSIAAGTYCSGKQTIDAIPSSYVQPNYTSSGGTYTLDPGESVSYNAKTYLTSALSVTAAASSSSNLNIFSIDNRIFKAEPGMTWAEWIDSDYAPDGFILNIDYTVSPTEYKIEIGDYTVCTESKPTDLEDLLVDNMLFAYVALDAYSEISTNGNYAVVKM